MRLPLHRRISIGLVFLLLALTTRLVAATSAQLSWSATSVQTNLTTPGAASKLYILVKGVTNYLGAEFDVKWDPTGEPDSSCIGYSDPNIKTSSGTTCTYLNRGTAVQIPTGKVNRPR